MFGIFQSFSAFLRRHLNQIDIIIITFYRPVNHIFMIRQLPISNHHFFRPDTVRLLGSNTYRISTRTSKFFRIIAFRFRNSHILSIILQYGNISDILHNIVRLLRSNIFVCIIFALHTNVISHSAHFCHISQFSSINHHL